MMNIHRKILSFLLFGVIGCLVLTTGCATSHLDAISSAEKKAGTVYAQVNKISPGTSLEKECGRTDASPEIRNFRMKVCSRLNEFNIVNWTLLKDKSLLNRTEAVPVSVNLKVGSIVKLNANAESGFRFVEVAAYEETETCKWVGSSNSLTDGKVTTAGKVVGGFIGGMLLVPAAVVFSSDRQGGVECNGWSFKDVYGKALQQY